MSATTFCLCLWRINFTSRFLLFIALGFCLASIQGATMMENRLPKALEGLWLEVEGYIADVPMRRIDRRGQIQRFAFTVTEIDCGDYRGHCPQKLGKLRLSYYGASQYLPGQLWRFKVKLKRPRGMVNPGTFDYQAWLIGENFAATGYVKTATELELRGHAALRYRVHQWRFDLAQTIVKVVEDKQLAGMVVALTTGIRHYLSKEDRRLFQQLGISHLMVISGLHIGMVAGVAYVLFGFLGRFCVLLWPMVPAQFWALGGSFFAALFYAMLAGFSLPTQRALIMLAFVQLGLLNCKKRRSLDALVAALAVVALVQPLALHSASFWLSFFAVVAIFFLLWSMPAGVFEGAKHSYKLKAWLWVQIGICLFMVPLTVFFFSGASVVAPLANAIAIPLISFWVVPLSLFAIPLLYAAPEFAYNCWQFGAYGLYWLGEIRDQISRWSYITWVDSHASTPALLLLLIAVVWIYFIPLKRLKLMGLILILPLMFPLADRPAYGDMQLTVLDVGQGLAIVVETKTHTLVYDTGPGFDSGFNTGEAVLWPFLLHRNISAIDRLIVSHGDNDHSGGAKSLLDLIPVGAVYSGEPEVLSIDAQQCHSQQAWQWDGVQFEILHPVEYQNISRANNRSCVLKITAGLFAALIPGDIGRAVETAMVATLDKASLRADLLVVPHHGSNTSSSSKFLSVVGSSTAVVSAGYLNRYRHPREKVIGRLRASGMNIFNTAYSGAINFKVVEGEIANITEYRYQKNYFWY